MMDSKTKSLPAWPIWLLWFLGFLILCLGTILSDALFINISIGPPYAITAALAYPFYLLAFRQTWPRNKMLPLAAAILQAWYLVFTLGLFEAIATKHTIIAMLIVGIILTVCFVLPVIVSLKPRTSETKEIAAPNRIVSWVLLLLVLLATFPAIGGLAISAKEFVQANAFREFCERKLEGLPVETMKKSVPPRFIRDGSELNEIEISSHGRGCIATITGERVTVKEIIPKSGFSWMLSAQEGAELKGAFEP